MYKGFQDGDFDATPADIESYREKCAKRFSHADLFKLAERNGIADETTKATCPEATKAAKSETQDTSPPVTVIEGEITAANG